MSAKKTYHTRVIRIHSVVDTRDYEEVNNRMVPIAGSGNEHECDRCGKLHEVHAHVEYEDGSYATVGTGCMGQNKELSLGKLGRNVAGMATTVAKKRAALNMLDKELALFESAFSKAYELPMPEPIVVQKVIRIGHRKGKSSMAVQIGDVVETEYWLDSESYKGYGLERATEIARAEWIAQRAIEIYTDWGGKFSRPTVIRMQRNKTFAEFERAERRLAKKMKEVENGG